MKKLPILLQKAKAANEAPNATPEEKKIGILHSTGPGFWVSNEGTKAKPNYHVWFPGITHATCDSAYNSLSLAVARCNYLARTYTYKEAIVNPIHRNKIV